MGETEKKITTVSPNPGYILASQPDTYHRVTGFYNDASSALLLFDHQPLVIGRQIKEVPTRGLEIRLRNEDAESAGKIIESLQQFALMASCDYVATDNYGNSRFKVHDFAGKRIVLVRPLLFNKIIDGF